MSAEETSPNYDTPYWRFVRETAERADRLPDWKKGDSNAVVGQPARENHAPEARNCKTRE